LLAAAATMTGALGPPCWAFAAEDATSAFLPSPPDFELPTGEAARKSRTAAMEGIVLAAAKSPMRVEEAPAVVTVVTRDEIVRGGYRSVAEVLCRVPGLYVVDDHLKYNLGVRGVNGGSRAWGSIVKVLVNGQPVSFRSDTSNYFGVELVPIDAVQQIEVIRGPASALYGANAFLGVINIVMRPGEDVRWANATAGGGGIIHSGAMVDGGLVGGARLGPIDFIVAGAVDWANRSGLAMPASSPNAASWPVTSEPISQDDTALPRSFFAQLSYQVSPSVRLSLDGLLQQLDSVAEWQDWGPLTHGSRIVENNGYLRAAFDLARGRFGLHASAAFVAGAPGRGDRLDIGRPDVYFRRRVGYLGVDGALEGRFSFGSKSSVIAGGDVQFERQSLLTYEQVNQQTGQVDPIGQPGERNFVNLGAYAQGVIYPVSKLGITAGFRVDYHNIYGTQPNGRLGIVWMPHPVVALKLLYGGSFKAPSAVQLFTVPLTQGDVKGNPDLRPQRAHVFETSVVLRPFDRLRLTTSGFFTLIYDQIVFELVGGNQTAQNLGRVNAAGAELEVRYHAHPVVTLFGDFSYVYSEVTLERSTFGARPDEPQLYPSFQGRAGADLTFDLRKLGLTLRVEGGWVGPRAASQSNVLIKGDAYKVAGYPLAALCLSTRGWEPWRGRETRLQLRGDNLLDWHYAEPGFGGVDVPSLGATIGFWVSQQM
jgi:iron complex outermembrane receptor protein